MPARPMYIYILASNSKVLYTGVTNDLLRRVQAGLQRVQYETDPGFMVEPTLRVEVYGGCCSRIPQPPSWLPRL